MKTISLLYLRAHRMLTRVVRLSIFFISFEFIMDAYRPRKSHPLLDRKLHKPRSPITERPAWDDSQHNLSNLKLTLEEQVRIKKTTKNKKENRSLFVFAFTLIYLRYFMLILYN